MFRAGTPSLSLSLSLLPPHPLMSVCLKRCECSLQAHAKDLKRMGTQPCRKSTNLSACALVAKKKSTPSWMSLMLVQLTSAPCLRMSCSRNRKVLLWYTCCLSCSPRQEGRGRLRER